jgi:hypothetical protein
VLELTATALAAVAATTVAWHYWKGGIVRLYVHCCARKPGVQQERPGNR